MNFEKRNNLYKIIMLMIATAVITFLLTAIIFDRFYITSENGLAKVLSNTETTELNTKIQMIRAYLDKFYLGNIDDKNTIEGAMKGYVAGLGDEYTEYLTKDEYDELMIDVNGTYVGIGIYMTYDRFKNIIILLPIEGSSAEEAGIKSGDIITKINGNDCTKMDITVVAKKIKGEEGTTVDLEILRDGQIINKTVERRKIQINHVKAELIDNNVGYIKIMAFDNESSKEFEVKLRELLNKNIKSLIIDVRNNGGGIVTEAINVAELFIPKNKNIMIEKDKSGKEQIKKSERDSIINSDLKIIILGNENSASAAEILISALKDNNIAQVVGIKTYGKGVMQEIVPVESGGALKLTIKEFRTPNGDIINKNGIKPNIEIKDDEKTEIDEQLQKAIEMCK